MLSSARSQTGAWEQLSGVKDQYVKTLRVCIGISRGYYSAELKAVRQDRKLKAKGQQQLLIGVRQSDIEMTAG